MEQQSVKEGFKQAGFLYQDQLTRAINRMKAETYFIIGLRLVGNLGSTFLGNHIIIDNTFDWTRKIGGDIYSNIKASFLSIVIHELGNLVWRIDDEREWYNLTPQKTIIQADIKKEELISSLSVEKPNERDNQPIKKFQPNSGNALPVPISSNTSNLVSNESPTINLDKQILDSQILIEKFDNEMGSYVET